MRNIMEVCKEDVFILFTIINLVCHCLFMLLLLEYQSQEVETYETTYTNEAQTEYEETDIIVAKKINYKDEYLAGYEIEQASYLHDLIIGEYYFSNDIQFCFEPNGVYGGFFDNKNKSVSGYKYEIVSLDDVFYVNIYNKEETAAVQYRINFKSRKLILCYEPSGLQLQLRKEE